MAKRDSYHHPYFAGHGYAGVRVALWQAERSEGREGIVAERLPHDELLALLSEHGRLADRPA